MEHPTLVTGGAGFLGSYICEQLVKKGDQVLCLDNFSTGHSSNIEQLLENKNFQFITHDVVNDINLDCGDIYNLACPASPIAYQRDPISTLETAVLGPIKMLGLAKKMHSKIFQASTSEIYGDAKWHPQSEDYFGNVNPIGIRACYDEGKRCAETLCFDYNRQYGVAIRVGRIFNTYGPRMQIEDGRVVSNFIVQAIKNEPITIYGSGEQTRSFCFVDDLVEGIFAFVAQGDYLGPVNIGNPCEISILELADTICKLCRSRSVLKFKALPKDDPVKRCPDISKIKNLTGWHPKVALEDGLKETIKYFEKALI